MFRKWEDELEVRGDEVSKCLETKAQVRALDHMNGTRRENQTSERRHNVYMSCRASRRRPAFRSSCGLISPSASAPQQNSRVHSIPPPSPALGNVTSLSDRIHGRPYQGFIGKPCICFLLYLGRYFVPGNGLSQPSERRRSPFQRRNVWQNPRTLSPSVND